MQKRDKSNGKLLATNFPVSLQIHEVDHVGKCCICGLYNAYDEKYPCQLSEYIDATEYERLFEEINDRLTQFWPCCCCFTFGYICTLCTCGLSLLCPNLCVTQAKGQLDNILTAANNEYHGRGLHFEYCSYNCSTTSKILIYYGHHTLIEKQFN